MFCVEPDLNDSGRAVSCLGDDDFIFSVPPIPTGRYDIMVRTGGAISNTTMFVVTDPKNPLVRNGEPGVTFPSTMCHGIRYFPESLPKPSPEDVKNALSGVRVPGKEPSALQKALDNFKIKLNQYVEKNPKKAAAIAAGIGAVIGATITSALMKTKKK